MKKVSAWRLLTLHGLSRWARVVATAAITLAATAAFAQNNPVDQKWWPSEFGADDQAGATKYIDSAKRVAAAKLVTKGEVATDDRTFLVARRR